MYKNDAYTFSYDDWKYGMNKSPYAGVSWMQNIDPFTKQGALICGPKAVATTDAIINSFPRHAALDEKNDVLYLGLDGGRLVSVSAGGTVTSISIYADECHGMAVWKDYVFTAGETRLECYDIDGTFFYNNWKTFAEGRRGVIDLPHQILAGRDDVLYITDGIYIASLQEQVGQTFDANNAATYTWNSTALDLPSGYVASSLTELGTYLLIGTYYTAALNRGNRADIFPWNRTAQSFQNPVRSRGNGVWSMVEHNSEVFALYDTETQKIAKTNLTFYQALTEIRKVTNARIHPDAVEVVDEEILFGIGSNSASGENCAVYGIKQVGQNWVPHIKNTLSVGTDAVEIGALVAMGDGEYIATWEYDGTYGYDTFGAIKTDDYSSYAISAYQVIARQGSKKQFKTLEIQLGTELASGQGVRVSYRANRTDSFTELATFDFATHGAEDALSTSVQMSPLTGLEIKVELKGSGETTPEFLSLSLI